MSAEFYIVKMPRMAEINIKKSRFIGIALPCDDEQDAIEQLHAVAADHPQANHIAFAWRLRSTGGQITERVFDAGEPSGTAGKPILAPIMGQNLINLMVVVVRYFGGVKLGAGGLTRAYGQAAKTVLQDAKILPWVEMTELPMEVSYPDLQLLEYELSHCNGEIIAQDFTDRVHLTIRLPAEHADTLKQRFSV